MNGSSSHYGLQRKAHIAESSKSLIQQEWMIAGRPHNIICSQCLKPGNMIPCSTCCRSYHAACLTALPSIEAAASWSCPSCQERQQTINYPLDQLISSPLADASAGVSATMAFSPTPRPDFDHAKKFLADHGVSDDRDVSADFLRDLQQLIAEAQLASQKDMELTRLRGENSQLIEEIKRLKADSKSPHSGRSPSHGLQHVPTPPKNFASGRAEVSRLDVSDKSWDRIISEAF